MRRVSLGLVGSVVLGISALSGNALADNLADGLPSQLLAMDDTFVIGQGLSLPTSFAFLPDGRMIITEKGGRFLIRQDDGTLTVAGNFPVDDGSEKGLLNALLHPDFAANRLLIFYYSRDGNQGGSNADRHRVVTVPLGEDDTLDRGQEQILVRGLEGPANHDGGAMAIGPDGKLYIGVGDTGCNANVSPPDPSRRDQQDVRGRSPRNYYGTCLTKANGKILRVNLDGTIPADNPLVGVAQVTACGPNPRCTGGAEEDIANTGTGAPREDIWAWGFRNPWRFWFDKQTGNLWVGDVGENAREELTVIPQSGIGKHYGWPWREGFDGYPQNQCAAVTPNVGDCVDPNFACEHNQCESITGGLIVDSCEWPEEFRGKFFFGDSENGRLWTVQPTEDRNDIVQDSQLDLGSSNNPVVHFGFGPDNALYYASLGGQSRIVRIAPQNPIECSDTTPNPDPTGGAGGAEQPGGAGAGGVDEPVAGGGGAPVPEPNPAPVATGSDVPTPATGGSSGATGAASDTDGDSGCGCRLGAAPTWGSLLPLGLGLLLAGWWWRRRQ